MSDSQQNQQPTTDQSESVTIIDHNNQNDPLQQQQQAPSDPSSPSEGLMSRISKSLLERHMQYDPISILFTIMVFAGGIVGYVKADSVVSLVSGTMFAILLAIGTYFEGSRKNPYLLLVALFGLGILMLYRYLKSYAFMPARLIGLLTLIMFARHCYLIYLKKQSSP